MAILNGKVRTHLKPITVVAAAMLTVALVLLLAGSNIWAVENRAVVRNGKLPTLPQDSGTESDASKPPVLDDFVPVETMPEMIYRERPKYPGLAKKAKAEGTVWVKALVDTTGKISEVQVGKSSGHELLNEAAVAAAYKCKFKPATQKGKPVAVWITYKVEFTLDDH